MSDKIKFTLKDVVNLSEGVSYLPDNGKTSFNPHNVHPFVIHQYGHVICVVFASCLSDALDEAVDENKLDSYQIDESDYADYKIGTDEETCSHLGNASEPFDISELEIVEMTNEDFFEQLLAVQIEA